MISHSKKESHISAKLALRSVIRQPKSKPILGFSCCKFKEETD